VLRPGGIETGAAAAARGATITGVMSQMTAPPLPRPILLKMGCKAEDSRLRTAQRLTNLISIFCIVSWRIFWMTMINRAQPEAPPASLLTDTEIHLLDCVVRSPRGQATTLSNYLTKLAGLGSYLARAGDPPPGNTVI
jgi:hypothetical protein